MSATLTERPPLYLDSPPKLGKADAFQHSPDCSGGGRLTLLERLDSVWEGLHADGAAECPLCHERMSRTAAPGGECGSCSSTIA